MIYVIKKFDDNVREEFGTIDSEFPEHWKKQSELYFETLDVEEKQKFIKHYPNYISNVFSRHKNWIDADVLNEWKIYLDKIIKPEYWNFDLVIKDDSLFNNPDAEQFFSYLTDSYKREDDLKAVTLSFIYHKFNGSYIDSKESLYVEYCNDKFSGLKFTQLQQKSRFRKDEPAYDSDKAIIRRNVFNKAVENWNNLYSNKQLKFY